MYTLIKTKRLKELEDDLEITKTTLVETMAKLDLFITYLGHNYTHGTKNKPHFRRIRCDYKDKKQNNE